MGMKLNEILDVDIPAPGAANTALVALPAPDVSEQANNSITQDAIDARNNIRTLIAQGSQAVAELLALARDARTPRAYEVASNMLKTMSELSHDLLEVHQREQSLAEPEEPAVAGGDIHIGQAVFVGSTSDLGELVKQRRAKRNANTITVEAETIGVVQTETSQPEVLSQESKT